MLLRHTLLYLPAQVAGPLAQVCAALVWTHWLAPAPYGLLTFFIASQDLLFLICMSWWTHYTMRYLGVLNETAYSRFIRSETSVFSITCLMQVAGMMVVLGALHEHVTGVQFAAAAAYAGTRSLLTHLGERARAQSRIGIYTLGQVFGSIFGFAAAYLAVLCVAPTLEAVLSGFAIAQALGVVILYRRLGIARGDLLPHAAAVRAALAFGAPLLVAGGFAWLAQNGIRFIIEWTGGPEALGLLAVGWGLGMRLSATIAMLVVTASFPLAVQSLRHGSREDAYRHLSRGGTLLCALIVPTAIGICLVIELLTTLFVAEPFRQATIGILPFAAVTGAVRNIRMHVADPVFLLLERPRISTMLSFVDALLVMVGCACGAWIGGLMGAVIACLAATAISAIFGFTLAYRIAGFRPAFGHGLRIAVASGVMAAALAMVPWPALVAAEWARIAVESLSGAMVYALALAAVFPGEAVALCRRLFAVARTRRLGLGATL